MRALLLALSFFALPALAQDLQQVYRDAKAYDAPYAAARYALRAGMEKLPQGRALTLPTLNLAGNATNTRTDTVPHDSANASSLRDARSFGYSLSFSQPIFRLQNTLQFNQAEVQVKQSEANFGQSAQELIVRTAQAYFDVLAAQDTLALVQAQKTAISEQLAQAKRNFEVGTATITDTHEAQSRFDLSAAQEIAALNDLETKRSALQQISGKAYPALKPLRAQVKLSPPNPANMQNWVELAEKQGYPVRIQETATAIANLEAKRNTAGHYPTLDFVASYGTTSQTASQLSSVPSNVSTGVLGLQLALPLYQGGSISSKEREAASLYEKAKQDLENARRSGALTARLSFLGVTNGIAQVGALEQALLSSQSALDSNKLGYEVGVRINIDVLNAQQQLFSTRRDLALARYNTITSHLKLKAAAGSLRDEDLEEVNRALQP
ncbi:MAG: channel protein TolC [Betaproteobacteria bacterium]|nr:channel protein TolC [Betaproteobacteria bacterium]MSQ87886.1 channel protein TolC [Betaproteobacteria bacterium]